MPEIGWGDFEIIDAGIPSVLAMRYDWRNNSVFFLHNLDPKPREVSFRVGLKDEKANKLVNLLTDEHSDADKRGRHTVLLEPFGYRWYRVGGLDYLLQRAEIDEIFGPQAK